MTKIKNNNNSLDSLVLLRCIAVFMVCFSHFGGALEKGHDFSSLFKAFKDYGIYGVHVFFVISGFVIPLSLLRGKYSIVDYPLFLWKRVLRLHPPYLAALALTLVIMFISYKVRHVVFPENVMSIFKSVFYLHFPPDNPVFWTLMVEAQYYIFIGLFYILLIKYSKIALLLVIPILLMLGQTYIVNYINLLQYIPFFLIGTVAFFIYSKIGSYILNAITLIGLFLFILLFKEIHSFIASVFSVIFILFFKKEVSVKIKFFGLISYSIYLIHFPIGIKFINYLNPKINSSYSWLLFLVTIVFITTISWVFYIVFESYSEKLSKRIKYSSFKFTSKNKFFL